MAMFTIRECFQKTCSPLKGLRHYCSTWEICPTVSRSRLCMSFYYRRRCITSRLLSSSSSLVDEFASFGRRPFGMVGALTTCTWAGAQVVLYSCDRCSGFQLASNVMILEYYSLSGSSCHLRCPPNGPEAPSCNVSLHVGILQVIFRVTQLEVSPHATVADYQLLVRA